MHPRTPFARWRLVLPLIALMVSPSLAGFTIRDLGVVVDSGTSGAMAINAIGGTTGMATGSGVSSVAAVSSGTGKFSPVSIAGASSSVGQSINIQGNVAGTYTDTKGIKHGFVMGTGQLSIISPLSVMSPNGTSSSGTYTMANGINDSGQVVGTGNLPGGATRAFTMGTGGSPSIIGPMGAGTFDVGNGINNLGTVVGTSEITPGGLQRAFITNALGNATDLLVRNSPGNFRYNTYGTAINNLGDVVGHGDVGSYEHAFLASSRGGAMVDLGILVGGMSSLANAVNDLDSVVGEVLNGTSLPGQPNSTAFLWTASTGMVDLNSLLLPADQSAWSLVDAAGINDLGQISGQGYLDGVLHGFVLTETPDDPPPGPADGTVPEPSAFLLSTMGLGIAAAWTKFGLRVRLRRGRTEGRASA